VGKEALAVKPSCTAQVVKFNELKFDKKFNENKLFVA
jgi:hypothetical protein